MQLEQAIQQLLEQKGSPMTVGELTEAINTQQLCTRRDGSPVCDFQVHGRSFNRKDLFVREGEKVKLVKSL